MFQGATTLLKQTQDRLKRETKNYKKIRDAVMPKVVRWKYYTDCAWTLLPEEPRPCKLTTKQKAEYGYGYDSSNRVIVVQSAFSIGPLQEFIRYIDDRVETSEFFKDEMRDIQTVLLKNGKPGLVVNAYDNGYSFIEYEWNGDVPSRYWHRSKNDKVTTEFAYDPKSKAFDPKFRIKDDGTRRPVDLPKGVTTKTLAEKIRKGLVKGVYDLVARKKFKEPIYCIALVYSGEDNPVFPPSIAIGLESERQKMIKKYGKEAKASVWNPEDGFTHYGDAATQIEDEDYDEACDWYSEATMLRSSSAADIKFINEIALELSKLNWSKIAKTADDFVVYAIDLEGADLEKNFKKTVPAETRQRLKEKGLL